MSFDYTASMRKGAFILVPVLALTGCESHTKPAPATQPAVEVERYYEPSNATALAFSPPIARDEAPLDLSRDLREPTAFVGYDDLIQSFFYIRTDDDDSSGGDARYERRAIMEKVGVSTR